MSERNKILKEQGSYLINGTTVIPLFIFIVVSLLLIAIFFSKSIFREINSNEFLIKTDGDLRGKREMAYNKEIFEYQSSTFKSKPFLLVEDTINTNLMGDFHNLNRLIKVKRYSLSEKKIIRYREFANEILQ